MSIEISQETETRLTDEARSQGISVDTLLARLLNERRPSASVGTCLTAELPVWHLGGVGSLHRRDIYDDVH